jgi:hypothetical protein
MVAVVYYVPKIVMNCFLLEYVAAVMHVGTFIFGQINGSIIERLIWSEQLYSYTNKCFCTEHFSVAVTF